MAIGAALIGGAALLGGSAISNSGQRSANRTNLAINKMNNAFNAKEASKTRFWSSNEARQSRSFNASEAFKDRTWQEKMSNSVHQREMEDLKKAGLNPILSALNGAPVTSGAMASSGIPSGSSASSAGNAQMRNEYESLPSAISAGVSSAGNLYRLGADVDLVKSQTALNDTNRTLRDAAIPAAEGVATVTKNLADLVKAVDSLVGKNQEQYRQMLEELREKMSDAMWYLDRRVKAAHKTIKEVKREVEKAMGNVSKDTRILFDSVWKNSEKR